jgi:hypothetical protein
MHRMEEGIWACTKVDLESLMNKKELKKFYKWIGGQTGPILPTGEFAYYLHDVERFIKKIRFNIPTYFD